MLFVHFADVGIGFIKIEPNQSKDRNMHKGDNPSF
jgi:hypothetical protein